MELNEMVRQLRLITESQEDDEILLSYISQAISVLMNRLYPYEADREGLKLPERLQMKAVRIAAYLMNKRGAEGEVQHIENGVHRNYSEADVPSSMLHDVLPQVGIPR